MGEMEILLNKYLNVIKDLIQKWQKQSDFKKKKKTQKDIPSLISGVWFFLFFFC